MEEAPAVFTLCDNVYRVPAVSTISSTKTTAASLKSMLPSSSSSFVLIGPDVVSEEKKAVNLTLAYQSTLNLSLINLAFL